METRQAPLNKTLGLMVNGISQHLNNSKRRKEELELRVRDLVLLKEPEVFNHTWLMARVTRAYPRKDSLVQVVDIYIRGKTYQRLVLNSELNLLNSFQKITNSVFFLFLPFEGGILDDHW